MIAAEFRAALAALGWSQREYARQAGLDARLVRRWATGQEDIPPEAARRVTEAVEAMRRLRERE